jgi:hypothetical protein
LWNDAFVAAFDAINESLVSTNHTAESVSLSLAMWLDMATSDLSAAASIVAACRSVFDLLHHHDALQQSNCAMIEFALRFASQEVEIANAWSDSTFDTNYDVADDEHSYIAGEDDDIDDF